MNEELKVIISAEVGELKKGTQEAQKAIEGFGKKSKFSLNEFSNAFSKMNDVVKKGVKAAAASIGALGGALLATVPATKEFREAQAKLATAFESAGGSADQAKETYNELYRVLGDDDKATEAASHLAKLTTNQKDLSEWTNICKGVYATFGESLPIEGLTEAANETAKTGQLTGVLADALNWAGVAEDEFQAKLNTCNTEAERERLIRSTLNSEYQTAAGIYEKNAAAIIAQNEANAAMKDSLAQIGEAMQPINTALTQLGAEILQQLTPYIQQFSEKYLPKIVEALSGVGEKIGEIITFIAEHWETIITIGSIIAGIATAIGLVSAAMTVVNTVMAIHNAIMMASPTTWIILGVVAAIAALVAIIVVCVKHWDSLKQACSNAWKKITQITSQAVKAVTDCFSNLWDKTKEIFSNMYNSIKQKFEQTKNAMLNIAKRAKDAVVNKFNELKDSVKSVIENIKENVKNIFENIRSTMSDKIKAAKENVLGIFDGIKNGIKEKINSAKNFVHDAIEKIKGFFDFEWSLPKIKLPHFSITGEFSLSPPSIPHFDVSWYAKGGVFDSPTLFPYGNGSVGGLGEAGAEAVVPLEKNTQWLDRIAERLQPNSKTPIYLQVDGRTFAEISVDSINALTRQRGSIPLKI